MQWWPLYFFIFYFIEIIHMAFVWNTDSYLYMFEEIFDALLATSIITGTLLWVFKLRELWILEES